MQSYINIKSIHLTLSQLVSKTSPLVGFKYQKADDWLDSKFQCSYIESRGVPEKTREIRGKNAENISLSLPVTSLPVTSGDVTIPTNPPQMWLELYPYTTRISTETLTSARMIYKNVTIKMLTLWICRRYPMQLAQKQIFVMNCSVCLDKMCFWTFCFN